MHQAGGDPAGLQVQGGIRVVKRSGGGIDHGATFETVPALVTAGVTDFRMPLGVPKQQDEAVPFLQQFVDAFQAAAY